MSRFYDGQPVACVWTRERWGPSIGEFIPALGQRCVIVRSKINRYDPGRIDVELQESRASVWYDERGFEPLTENQVQAIIAMTTDLPTEDETKKRETQDA